MRDDRVEGDLLPLGMAEDHGDRIGHERQREQEEDPLGVAVRTDDDQQPDGHRSNRDRQIARHTPQFEGACDTCELSDDQAEVGYGEGEDGEGGQAQGELLADQGRQPLAGMCRQAGGHLLDAHVADGDDHHEEQHRVPELGPGRGVGGHAARVVAGVCRDETRAGSGQVDEEPSPPALRPRRHRRVRRCRGGRGGRGRNRLRGHRSVPVTGAASGSGCARARA